MTAKVLLYDVETAPLLGYAWGAYDTNILKIVNPVSMLSFASKWLGTDAITVKALPDYPAYKPGDLDDKALVTDLWRLMDEADIVVGQNSDAFDNKIASARFLVNGLPPPSPYKTFDTLKAARKHFRLDSNKLGDIGQVLGIGAKKPHTGLTLWFACMSGDLKAWQTLKEYNVQDVALLEAIYLRLRPWANHPDVNLYDTKKETPQCPSCGSSHIQRRGTAVARTRRYQRFNCQSCGHWFSGALEKS